MTEDLTKVVKPKSIYTASEAVGATMSTIETRKKQIEDGTALSNMWGIPELDGIIKPYWPGDTVYVEALMSNGKSFIARMKAANALKNLMAHNQNKAVVWISVEETVEKVTAHFLSKMSGVSSSSIMSGRISDVEMHHMSAYVAEVTTWPLFIIGNSLASRNSLGTKERPVRLTMNQIEDCLDFIMNTLNVDIALLVLDYFQRVDFPDNSGDRMEPHMRNVADWLRTMAQWAAAPFIVCAQAKRTVAEKKPAIPGMTDIEWTNRAGQDADFIFGSWFPKSSVGVGGEVEKLHLFNGPTTIASVSHRHMLVRVVKQRDGQGGDLFLLEAYPEKLEWYLMSPESLADAAYAAQKRAESAQPEAEQAPIPF